MKKLAFLFFGIIQLFCLSLPGSYSHAQTRTYEYDALGRVIKVEDPVNANRVYEYDSAGNRTLVKVEIPASTPTILPNGGTFTAAQSVQLQSATADAAIYYTTNNSIPTTSSPRYSTPFVVGANATVRAMAFKPGMNSSPVASAAFTILLPTAKPVMTPVGGTYMTSRSVTLSSSTPGASIYYTTNNTTPTTSSILYSSPFTLTSNTTVRAIAVKSGHTNSPVSSGSFTIVIPRPTISPNGGTRASPQPVTLTSEIAGASIYYTTNNTAPTTSSSRYVGPLSLVSDTTLRAIAVKSGMLTSSETSATFVIIQRPAMPTNLQSRLVADCVWTASWNAVAGADNYYFMDTLGNTRYVTTTSTNVLCPVRNSQSQKPKSVQACKAGICGLQALF